ncbi:MAG: CHASE2 domain-containing protein, partial [Ketobacteraceae bacterium]|nr:CHASE2 domain-containing protein [Ketobacteraceae bacterium]
MQRIRLYLVLLAVVLSTLVYSAAWWGWADTLNKLVYDQLLRLRPADPPGDVIIIAVDEYSLSHVGEWPWSRRYHAKLIDILTSAGVRAIGFDVVFAEPNPLDPEGDAAFVRAIRANGKVVLPVYIDRTQLGGQLIEVLPHPMFAEHARMGHVNTELDRDGIVRRFYHYEGIGDAFWPHFATVVAELAGGYRQPDPASITDKPASPLVNVRKLPRLIPFLGGVGSFQQVSFYDVINGKVPPRLFRDRVVFIGATSISLGDLLPTPVTVQGEQMPGVEINATIFSAARQNSFIHAVEPRWRALLGVIYVLATLLLIPRVAGRSSLLFIVVSSLILLMVQALLLLRMNLWLPLASALIAQWLVYPLWTVLRLDQTLRYLKKQLILLREELGQQSLAEHHAVAGKTMAARIEHLMEMASITAYGLFINQRLVSGSSSNDINGRLPRLMSLPQGPARENDLFSCRYRYQSDDYLLVVPVAMQPLWNELKEVYIVGFFENELTDNSSDYTGAYDLVFKYLNEVRRSQVEVNNARLLFEYCVNEMNDGVIIADEYGEVLFINRLALKYLGIQHHRDVSLMDVLMKLGIRTAEDNGQNLLFQVLAERSSRELETTTGNGDILLANLSYLEAANHRANLLIINLYDITRIREAQRMRNETIDFLSHDMRSPMVSLIALVDQKR